MKTIIRYKWAVIALWIAAAAVLLLTAPNMGELVREKGQLVVPDGYSSVVAADILNETAEQEGAVPHGSLVLVLHNKDGQIEQLQSDSVKAAEVLRAKEAELGIKNVLLFVEQPALAAKLVSADQTTVLLPFEFERGELSAAAIRDQLSAELDGLESEHYLTGSDLISEDVVINSQEGLKKTEYITVIIILVILFIVFRSAVAPFVPLLTIGLSYLVAQSVVAFLVDWWNFPLSTFTQIFMVAVMFGIGTDYCILLISRFKEELSQGKEVKEAILATYKTAGKTVLFAGIAVMVGFSSIIFSQFVLYRSAVAVGVGILVLMIALITIVPFFMAVLGKKLFWPGGGKLNHPESKAWAIAGNFSLKRPLITLLLLAVIIVPIIFSYDGDLSYNSLDEIGDEYDSVQGFNLVAEGFGPGESMPTQIVLRAEASLEDQASIGAIEALSAKVAEVEGVASVRSVSRPTGEPASAQQMDLSQLTPVQQAALQAQYAQVLDTYLSKDRKVTTIDVVFEGNPYATETLDQVKNLEDIVNDAIKGTSLEGAELGFGGVSSIHADLRDVSGSDYNRTIILMLAGIAIILFILLRSIVMPIYLIGSLLLTYYMTMSATEFIFMNVLDYSGISWAVPFFAFVILLALGVDYSIFLMGRFNENRSLPASEAILAAMKNMGTVIFSAAIILAGTFAAMLPAGVLSLLQIATVVIVGLALYSLVFLPFFVPVMVKLFGRFNWWPFMKK